MSRTATAPSLRPIHGPQAQAHEHQSLLDLWAAVFQLGLRDAVSALRTWDNDPKQRGMDAWPVLTWLYTPAAYPGSFIWLCQLFDLQPDRVRAEIKKEAEWIRRTA